MLPLKRASLMGKVTDSTSKSARIETARGPILACVRYWGSSYGVFGGWVKWLLESFGFER